ncbi:MAG: 16S rRNA (cytidine(1402)-2'-O)-methyltransferase [Bacteroidales bacterium]|jgi:16S rRNA (cytidine1402-2'-O)-methyltransferase|nr:16S rRNA (cytidine(1402)-2'-O)-methyltransferase [Bacteroidales bacterium]
MESGKLYLVPTPVGNLEDITLRALSILKSVDVIYAEDTRTSSVLLKKYGISTHMESYHKFNEHKKTLSICDKILSGQNAALITDAGSPGISDPGFLITRDCIENGIEVEALPGATAFVPALTVSGLPSDRFCFEGFLPQKKGRQTRIREIAESPVTSIIYESPYRLLKLLESLKEFAGGHRRAAVCREISKIHNECKRGTLEELVEWFTANEPKGEIVVIIEGKEYGKDQDGQRHNGKRCNSDDGSGSAIPGSNIHNSQMF